MRILPVLIAASMLLALPAAGSPAPSPGPGWPPTEPGRHAQAWFTANAAGEEAMRAFWTSHGSAASLTRRPVEARLQVWREIHANHGALNAVRVSGSGADFCEVLAHSARGEDLLIRFLCDAEAPHGLTGIGIQPADGQDEGPSPPGGPGGPGNGPGAGAPPPSPGPDPGPKPTDDQLVAAFGSELDSLSRIGEFSGAAFLDKGGRMLLARAAGMASRVERIPNTSATRFNLGSLNKIFTHVAIEQLAQAGKLRLEDPVTRYLPDYKVVNGQKITLRMLLQHRGGVPDVLMNPELEKEPERVRTQAAWYALVREMPLRFEPGARQQYSNGGFVLLGQVIANVSGEDYYDYIRGHLYRPAGMTRSDHYAMDERVEGMAVGYTTDGDRSNPAVGADTMGGRIPNTESLFGRGSAAGGGYSTVEDFVRFAQALRDGKLLDAEHVRDVFGERFQLGIAGGSPGVNGLFVVEGPYTLVVLSNQDPPSAEHFIDTVGRMVRRAAGLRAPVRPPLKAGGHP